MKKLYLLLFFISFNLGNAQSWQWAKRGGGDGPIDDNSTERVKAIATDSQGNVYALCPVSPLNLDIDGNPRTGWSPVGSIDYVLTSFDCQGNYRWSKVIGGHYSDNLNGLSIDAQDNVYVTGRVLPSNPGVATVHFDSDFELEQSPVGATTNMRGLFLIKYSRDGIFQWVRWPQPEDITSAANAQTFSLAFTTDQAGNSWWFVRLRPGTYAGNYVVTASDSFHVLRYDAEGNFISGIPISINAVEGAIGSVRMGIHPQSGRMYFAGKLFFLAGETVSINGIPVTTDMYLAAYDASGQYLWHKQGTQFIDTGYGFENIFVNEASEVYLLGATRTGMGFETHSFSSSTLTTFPFLLKTDQNGNVLWGTNAVATANAQVFSITEGAMTGGVAGTLTWNGHVINIPANTGYDVYMTRFNPTTGEILALEAIADNDGYADYGSAITKDLHGNFYVGGSFASQLYVNGQTLTNNGQQTDFFVAKFGSDDCTLGVEAPIKKGLQLHPNPAREKVFIEENSGHVFEIVSVLGQRMLSGVIGEDNSIQIEMLPAGVYFVVLKQAEGVATVKFIKL